MAGADRAGVDARIAEVLVGDGPVLVAEEPVLGDDVGIERDLDLGVEGHRLERAGEALDEQLARFVEVR